MFHCKITMSLGEHFCWKCFTLQWLELTLNSGGVECHTPCPLSYRWWPHGGETVMGSVGSCHSHRKHLEPWTHGPRKACAVTLIVFWEVLITGTRPLTVLTQMCKLQQVLKAGNCFFCSLLYLNQIFPNSNNMLYHLTMFFYGCMAANITYAFE